MNDPIRPMNPVQTLEHAFIQIAKDEEAGRALAATLPGMVAEEVMQILAGQVKLEVSRSEKQGELVKALCRARPSFGVVERSRTAKVTPREGKGAPYTYDYSTLSDSIAATTDALAGQDLVVFQDFDQTPGKIIIYTELAHGSDQWRRSKLTMPVARDAGPQGIGSAITYGRRYARNAMLDLAPADDDDGQAAQKGLGREGREGDQGGGDGGLLTLDKLPKVAQTDPVAAFTAVRRLIASVMGCGDISKPRQRRLYAVAHSKRGWTADQVDGAVTRLLGATSVPRIPYKAYKQVVALFQNVMPASVLTPPAQPATTAPSGSPPAAQQGAAPQGAPPQQQQAPAEPPPTWREAWDKIRTDYDDLAPDALANPLGAASVPAVLEGFMKAGWTRQEIEDVLRVELYGATVEKLPKDGTHPPVYRKVAKAFRVYKPADVLEADRKRYGWAPPVHEEEPPFGDGEGANVIAEALALIPDQFPETADEAWRSIRTAMDAIGRQHPEALVPITPDDRLTLFRKQQNGNRSTGDVDALTRHHLGVRVESVPSLVFDPVLRLLAAFPSRNAGKEEVLGKLPTEPGKMKPMELRDILQRLVQDGTIQDDEITRSGEGGKVTKEDMVGTIERVRKRALLEAGHA